MKESNEIFLELSGIRTWYSAEQGIVRAVDGASLSVQKGKTVGIVGESGSGKTQLLMSSFGLSTGTPGIIEGSARFGDVELLEGLEDFVSREADGTVRKDLTGWARAARRKLARIEGRYALIFQAPKQALLPYWTVRRHLEYFHERVSTDVPADAWMRDRLARFGFPRPDEILDSFPDELSGGEAQRVMLTIAGSQDIDLLIADEPTTAVDAVSQWRILQEIEEMTADERLSAVVVSHDMAVIELLADRVMVMFKGTVVEEFARADLHDFGEDEIHPYLHELRSSQLERRAGEPLEPKFLPVLPPTPQNGCPFAARCDLKPRLSPEVQSRCSGERPTLVEREPGHRIACWGRVE